MLKRAFTIIAVILSASSALGQQARVLSGEHSGFSRLVAPVLPGSQWSVSQMGREVTFRVDGFDQGFDLSNVYNLIPRDRVQAMRPTADGFIISLGCDCRVAPFLSQNRFVVMDVASPDVSRPAPFVELTAPPRATPVGTVETTSGDPLQLEAVNETATALPKTEPLPTTIPILPSSRTSVIEPLDIPALARAPLPQDQQDVLEEIQSRLVRELGTATTQGILTPLPNAQLPSLKRPQIDLRSLELPAEEPTPPPMPDNVAGLVNNMRISSSMDLPVNMLRNNQPQSLSGFSCPVNDDVDLASWTDERPFHEQAGTTRRQLFLEFDRLDQTAALTLAQTYLHFGFGAEAEQILRLDETFAQEHSLLIDIARIMETGSATPNSMLRSLLDCETDVALWAILAEEELNVPQSVDPRPALLALNKLPVHLRNFLAPALSKRLLSHGDTDAAAMALRNLERRPVELPPAAKLAQANVALEEGEIESGKETLAEVIEDNSEDSPEALITLIETKLDANQPIDPETARLVEAYAKELKDDRLGPALRHAHVLALVKSGQFDRAFDASAELGGGAENNEAVKLRLRLLSELTAAAGDVVFLEHVFEQSERDVARLPVREKIALATRLLELGFAERAQTITQSIPLRPRNNDRQTLAARIALQLEQPQAALTALADVTDDTADLMRAQARQMNGEHEAAFSLFQAADEAESAVRAAWLAENWQTLTPEQDEVFGPISAISSRELALSTDPNGMLARSAAALEESATARQTLLDMLRAPEFEIITDGATQ